MYIRQPTQFSDFIRSLGAIEFSQKHESCKIVGGKYIRCILPGLEMQAITFDFLVIRAVTLDNTCYDLILNSNIFSPIYTSGLQANVRKY